MKKVLFAILTVTVMLLSGFNTIEVSAKEHEPKTTEVKKTKKTKTKKKVKKSKETVMDKAESKFRDMIMDYIDDEYSVHVTNIDITYINKKMTQAEFLAVNDDETVVFVGKVKLTKKLWFDSVDWSVVSMHS